jgi:hypothetical protein
MKMKNKTIIRENLRLRVREKYNKKVNLFGYVKAKIGIQNLKLQQIQKSLRLLFRCSKINNQKSQVKEI